MFNTPENVIIYANAFFDRMVPVMMATSRAYIVECRNLPIVGAQFRMRETFIDGSSASVTGWLSTGKMAARVHSMRTEANIPEHSCGYWSLNTAGF